MAAVTVSPGSWLNLSRLLEFQGVVFWDQTEYPDIPFSDGDQYLQLNSSNASRIDLIANDYYGDSELLWVLLLANNKDLPNQFIEGDVILIPSIDTINDLLNSADANFIF